MPENDSYALWIMPEGEAYSLTDSYIEKLSKTFNLPGFEPHVTILAGISQAAISKVRGFAEILAPFWIRLAGQPEYLDEYFRCLFLKAHETPELMDTISKAGKLFGDEGSPQFPHLSLAYGSLPVETKHEMIRTLGNTPEIAFEARHLSLLHASVEMPIESWKVVERFPLIH